MGLLRLVLAIVVVVAHAGPLPYVTGLVGGATAVQAFFMISGFYMALVLHEKYDRALPFYWNRLSKIYSGYFVALAVAILGAALAGTNHISSILSADWDVGSKALALISNFFIVGSDWLLFTYPSPEGLAFTPNFTGQMPRFDAFVYLIPAWSLPLELTFYAMAPFVVRRPLVLVGLAGLSIASRFLIYRYIGTNDPWSYRFFPNELVFFVAGVGAYYAYRHIRQWRLTPLIGWATLVWLSWLMVDIGHAHQIADAVPYDIPGLLFLGSVAVAMPFIFAATKGSRTDRWLGELSYPIYLVHIIVILNFERLTGLTADALTLTVLSVITGIALRPVADGLDRYLRNLQGGLWAGRNDLLEETSPDSSPAVALESRP